MCPAKLSRCTDSFRALLLMYTNRCTDYFRPFVSDTQTARTASGACVS